MTDDNITPSDAQDAQAADDHKLAAEAARRRVQAREAAERADAAEREANELRAQIAELRLSQARQQVTAKHPELTAELIEKYAPEGVDADGLAEWAEKSLGLVVALRGEPEPDSGAMSDAERELAAARLDLAIQQAVTEHEHVTVDVLDALCGADTPEGVAEWAAAFEQVAAGIANESAEPTQLQLIMQGVRANKVGGGKMKGAGSGMEGVAQKLVNR